MGQKLVIELSEEATANYLKWARVWGEACAEADAEPDGLNIRVNIGIPDYLGTTVYAGGYGNYTDTDSHIEFGEATTSWIET